MIVAVASGKGGTGKTIVATSLALAIAENGRKVQFLDCDVEEPNAHIFLKPAIENVVPVSTPVPVVDKEKCTYCGKCAEVCQFNALAVVKGTWLLFENLCHGCDGCGIACPEDAISEGEREIGVIESGPSGSIRFAHGKLNIGEAMAPPLIRTVRGLAEAGCETIIDVPPGTSCPVVESVKGVDFVLLVTEPTPFGLNDLKLAVEMLRLMNLPNAVVINRAGVGDSGVEEYCQKEGIPIALRIPFDKEIAKAYSRGAPLIEARPEWRRKLRDLYESICSQVEPK